MLLTLCSSSPVVNTTWIQADAPTSFSLDGTIESTSLPFSWQDGAVGNPEETYTIICSTNTAASSCVSPGGTVVEETGIARGTQQGNVTGMTADTEYACWVKAANTEKTADVWSTGRWYHDPGKTKISSW